MAKVNHTLDPIFDKNSKILILGSIPSIKSREIGFYYAHPQNRFWQILELIFKVKLNTIQEKKQFLLNQKIALWDVFKSVSINGSNDSSIKNGILNNLEPLLKYSQIKAIFTTGKLAYNTLTKNLKTNLPIIYLPSPSSANASKSLTQLVENYQIITKFLKE